jgi:long-subunit acyl-CoA synthetase (AMP-forming)
MTVDPMRTYPKWGLLDEASEQEGFGQCLWNVEAKNKTCKESPDSGATTLVEILTRTVEKYGSRPAVGWRKFVRTHDVLDEKSGKTFPKLEFENRYNWMTYNQYKERCWGLAVGLASVGLKEKEKLVIYAETQRDWMVSAYAAWYNNAQVVTIYATLGEDGAIHGINQTKASVVVADTKLMSILVKILPKCPSVKCIVTMDKVDDATRAKVDSEIKVKSIDELITEGGSSSASIAGSPTKEDIAVIMYTSGTTGPPKGVVISHKNVVATSAGVEHMVKGLVTCEDVYQCYLPLAHIMEMVAEVCFMAMGAALGFGSPHTLTDTGIKLKRPESNGDAPTLQPSFMVFAPAVLDKVYQSVQSKRQDMGGFKQTLFQWGLNSGERHFNNGSVGSNWFFNSVVFSKVQGLVGGKLKAMITGSAPLSPDIQKFCQTVFKAPVRQGYGLTETCAGSCVGFWGDNATGAVGPPTVSSVIRLADWPEGNYRNKDKDDPTIGMRRGEVLIGGPGVTIGYYIDPENRDAEMETKNKEDWVDIQGMRFFRTGDVGQITTAGQLQIIDRKKDLWKGPNGEYVALTKVEAALKLNEFVEMPMCYGKTGGEYPIALICPSKARITSLAAEVAVTGTFEELCKKKEIVDHVSKELIKQCKASKLVEFEIPKKYALISELWTPENDLLTAAMKLKRPIIVEACKAEIAQCYA